MEERQQYTEVNGTSSELKEVRYGVPQDSLLGPRLFSIFMNDISESISAGEVHLYADDITAFVIGVTTDETIYKMQVLAKEVTQWCRIKKMTVNTKKTEAMIVQSRKFIGPLLPVEIADDVVDYKEECKLLGVFIDRQLKWKTQIEKVRKKYTTYNAILRKISFLPSETLEKIYYSMIIPKITYGLLIWGTSSKNLMQKIETQPYKSNKDSEENRH